MTDEDTATEMYDVEAGRVDGVDGPANRAPFLILKASDIDPLTVASRVLKAKYTPEQQRRMVGAGTAMKGPDGEPMYPVGDVDDLGHIIKAAEHAPDADKVRRFARLRATQLGAADQIPDMWAADGSLITKAASMDDDLTEALDAGVIEPGDVVPDAGGVVAPTHPGDPDDVASPAWEAVDAARARAAVEQVVALRALVKLMESREDMEVAATGDYDDARNSIDLDQVVNALNTCLAALAPLAATEQAEADSRAQAVADQAAALGITKAIESSVEAITKAGRVLSAANEASLRAAHASLTEVLGRVPGATTDQEAAVTAEVAPTAVTKAADVEPTTPEVAPEATAVEPVEKSTEPTETPEGTEPVVKAGLSPDDFRKWAKKLLDSTPDDKLQDVVQALTGFAGPTGGDAAPEAAPAAEPAPEPVAAAVEPPVEPAPVEAPAPAPSAATGVLEPVAPEPDEPIQKAAGFDVDAFTAKLTDLFKSQVADAVAPVLKRLEVVEATPAPGGPMLNGAGPADTPANNGGGFAAIQKAIDLIEDPAQRRAAQGAAVHQILTGVMGGQIATR